MTEQTAVKPAQFADKATDRQKETDTPDNTRLVAEGYTQSRVETPAPVTPEVSLPQVSLVDATSQRAEPAPRQLNDQTVQQYALQLHQAINRTNFIGMSSPDEPKVFQMLQSLGEADRKAIAEAYKNAPENTGHRDIRTDMEARMSTEGFRKAESMLLTRDGRTNDAGNLMQAFTQIGSNRADGERRVIETFATLNSEQMEQMRRDFRTDYGMTVEEARQKYGISPDAQRVLDFVTKPVEQRTSNDIIDLARFAVEKGNLDYLSIALRGDTPQAKEARRSLGQDADFGKKLVEAFKPAESGFFGTAFDYALGPIDEFVGGLIRGDLSWGSVLGGLPVVDQFGALMRAVDSKEANLNLLVATDLVREGRISLSTIALNNTGSLFGWFDNKSNINLAVDNATDSERQAFLRGRQLFGTTPSNETDRNALAYFNRLQDSFRQSGDSREAALWEAKLADGKNSTKAKLAEATDTNGRFTALENMSREEWRRLNDPQSGPQFKQELSQFISRFVPIEEQPRMRALIEQKSQAESYEKSQDVRRGFSDVIVDNARSGFFSTSWDGAKILTGVERLTADDATRYRDNATFREQTDNFIKQNLSPEQLRYAEHMLRQVAQTGKPYEKDGIGDLLSATANGADAKTRLGAVETLLQQNPELRQRLGGDPARMTPADRALRETIDTAVNQALLQSPYRRGSRVGRSEISRGLFEAGHLPVEWKANIGLKNRTFYEEAGKLPQQERQRLLTNRNLTASERQLIEKIADQGGEMRAEDRIRAFVVGDGSRADQYVDELKNLSGEQKQKLKEDYLAKYGSPLETDFLGKVERGDQQRFRALLTPSQTDGRQDYYDNLDEWLRSRSGGGLAPDGTALTVERAITDQAALNQWFNSRFEKMPVEVREAANEYFKEALQDSKESKAKMAELLATVALTAAALAATPFTGGASLALVAGIAAAAGGVAKVAIHRAVEGGDYDWNKALGQFVGGGAEGALNMLGGKIVEGMFKGFNLTGRALYGSMTSQGLLAEGTEAATGRAFTALMAQGKNVTPAALETFAKTVAPAADAATQARIAQMAREAVVRNFDHVVNRATFVALSSVDNAIIGGGGAAAMVVVQNTVDGRPIKAQEVLGAALVGAATGAIVGTLIRGGIEARDIYVQARRAPNGDNLILPSGQGQEPVVLEDASGKRRTVTEETVPGPGERVVGGPAAAPEVRTEPVANPVVEQPVARPDNTPVGEETPPSRSGDGTTPGADVGNVNRPAAPEVPPRTAKFEETLQKLEQEGGPPGDLARRIRQLTPEETFNGGIDEMLNAGKKKTRDLEDRVRYAEMLKRVNELKPDMPEGLYERVRGFMGESRKASQNALKLRDLESLLSLNRGQSDAEVARRLDGYFRAISDAGRDAGTSPALSDVFNEQEIAAIRRLQEAQQKQPKVELKPEERDALSQTMSELARREVPGGQGPAQDRVMQIVVGLPASGKSNNIVPDLALNNRAMVIDSDAVAPQIPGYTANLDGTPVVGLGANAVQTEAGRIATMMLNDAISNGDNIVYPFVGRDAEALMRKIIQAREAGYRVEVHFADVPAEEAARRAFVRGQDGVADGRRQIVDPEYVLGLGNGPRDAFQRVMREMPWLVDGWTHWNTNVPRGERPQVVAQSNQ